MRPLEVAARLLVGGRPLPEIVDVGQRRDLDLAVEVPEDELGAVCTNEQWGELYDRVAALAREHKSTLVFVNTRRLVERVTLHLGERLGADAVAAHHGSLSRERRHRAERRLKEGDLQRGRRDRVAGAGHRRRRRRADLPDRLAALDRDGPAAHRALGPRAAARRPKGRLFPLTRDQLVECAALVRAARRAEIDAVRLRDAPLDVLAQQIVAACGGRGVGRGRSCSSWSGGRRRTRSWRAATSTRSSTCCPRASPPAAGARARCSTATRVNRRLRGRRGARLAALTSGGAIPDNANYDVVLEPEGTVIGNVDEDFAIESMAGDIILLGNSSWRIRRVEPGRGARRGRGRRGADDPVLAGRGAGAHARAVGRGRGAARGDRGGAPRAARIRRRR